MSFIRRPDSNTSNTYKVRHAKNVDQFRNMWWANMLDVQWNRGPDDLATYTEHTQQPGILLGFLEGEPDPVGHIWACMNDNDTGWVAMFIVKDGYRQLRLGAPLWEAMIQDFREAGTKYVGLDAVPQQRATYARRGFVESTHGSVMYMTRPFGRVRQPTDAAIRLRDVREIPPDIVARLERQVTGFHRPKMWELFLQRPDVLGFAALDDASQGDRLSICGFATIRRSPSGARLSPLYAVNSEVAEALQVACSDLATPAYVKQHPMQDFPLHEASDETIAEKGELCVEAWTGTAATTPLFAKHGWTANGETHLMWLDDKPTPEQAADGIATRQQFAIFDAAIG